VIIFFDTSSLVKRYIEEPGSDDVDRQFFTADTVILSHITKTELLSALTRRRNDNSIDEDSYISATGTIEEDILQFEILPFNKNLENQAIEMIQKHGMKTLDAIQLASALLSNAGLTP
jgi:predicted nucleic acid-binding protein